ncbi:MAG: glycosyltransferase, partial [Bacteroidetes bacterium]
MHIAPGYDVDHPASLTAVVINYQTPDLLETAVRSFHRAYPTVPLLVIDNGSQDDSRARIEALGQELGPVLTPLLLEENIYHGPAMHRA